MNMWIDTGAITPFGGYCPAAADKTERLREKNHQTTLTRMKWRPVEVQADRTW